MSYYNGYYSKKSDLKHVELIENNIEIDWDLFETILKFRTHSHSVEQNKFADWLGDWCMDQGATVCEDKYGNVYAIKGEAEVYPCVVAHMDINQDKAEDVRIFRTEKIAFGFNNDSGEQCGLGFDDKCGVYFGMEMLKKHSVIKCYFAKDEEVGCQGTHCANMEFFKDCSFLIQLDRNSYSNDISESTNGNVVVSYEFMEASKSILDKFNYDYACCMYTDIGELVSQRCGCCAINVSCGYLHEHMDNEILLINKFINAIHFGDDLIKFLGDKRWEWEIKPKRITYGGKKYLGGTTSNGYNDWEEWEDVDTSGWHFDNISKEWVRDDFKEEEKPDVSKKHNHWHHSDSYRFEPGDEYYIKDTLQIGECPVCNSSGIVQIKNGAQVCTACDSAFYIPIGVGKSFCITEALIQKGKKNDRSSKKRDNAKQKQATAAPVHLHSETQQTES